MSSISSQALADSVSDLSEQGCAPSPSANETSTAEQSCESIGPVSPASMTSTGLTQTDWVGLDESISSVAASLVSPSVSLESRKAKRTTATSGRRCAASLHSQDPLGSLAKTLLVSSQWHSTMCSLTWKIKATPRGRLLFQLQVSALPTEETASGLLPTPTAQSYGSNQGGAMGRRGKIRYSLDSMAKRGMLPTPRCCSGDRSSGMNRTEMYNALKMWPTPLARDYKMPGMSKERLATRGPDNLTSAMRLMEGTGALNPTWVEWLMGFPSEWTALDVSAMPSSRKSRKSSGEQS
jgi:hypothetical protein